MWLLCVLLGTINPNFQLLKDKEVGKYIGGMVYRFVISLIFIGLHVFYFGLPPVYWPMLLWALYWPILLNAVITLIEAGVRDKFEDAAAFMLVVIILIPIIGAIIAISPYTHTESALRPLANVKIVDELPPEKVEKLNTDHMIVVPLEMARQKANNVISPKGKNYGALFHVGDLERQRIDSTQMYAAPLEFNGFFEWNKANVSPGFVLVNAEDPNQPAQLIELPPGKQMKYLPSAYWGSYLNRHLYNNGYDGYTQYENTFEVDDSLHPYFVCSMTKMSTGFTGHAMKKVVIVDPINGQITPCEPGGTPQWVDRSFPEDLAFRYADWWGKYVHGWFNGNGIFASGQDVQRGIDSIILVYGSAEHPDFFIQMTSRSSKDNALVGYFLFNSHRNEAYYFKTQGAGFGHQDAVLRAVNSDEGVTTPKFHANFVTFYPNVYGENTWVVPILSDRHMVEKIALVYAPNSLSPKMVAIGDNKDEALIAYLEVLARARMETIAKVPTDRAYLQEIRGHIVRIGQDAKTGRYGIELDNAPNVIFQVPPDLGSVILSLTMEGDLVSLQYLDTKEGILSVQKIVNTRYEMLKVSPEQQTYNQQVEEQRGTEKEKEEYRKLQEQQKRLEELKKKYGGTVK